MEAAPGAAIGMDGSSAWPEPMTTTSSVHEATMDAPRCARCAAAMALRELGTSVASSSALHARVHGPVGRRKRLELYHGVTEERDPWKEGRREREKEGKR